MRHAPRLRFSLRPFLAAIVVLAPGLAHAGLWGVNTGSVDAQANFTINTTAQTLTIDLTNLLTGSQIKDISQNISAIIFSGTNLGNSTSVTETAPDGYSSVSKLGKSSTATSSSVGWVFSSPGTNEFEFDDLSGSGHAGPAHTVIGLPDSNSKYVNANSSITGNGPHNPFVTRTAEFILHYNGGLSANSHISQVTIQFGTTDGSSQFQAFSEAPEPSPFVLSGILLSAIVLGRKYTRRRAHAAGA